MPQWAGSSWYFLRYIDPNNNEALASKKDLEYWNCVDWYNGGMEHTTLHLLYSRFWHKFLYDIGVVPTKEPYQKRTSHGMILGTNGEKMSKSKGNVINPDDIISEYGSDSFRVYEMFMGPFDQTASWSTDSFRGCAKFLDRVWNLQEILVKDDFYSPETEKTLNKAIKKISEDIEEMKFNTCISTLMSLVNEFYKFKKISTADFKAFLVLLNPFAPHITEELNILLGESTNISEKSWPVYDSEKIIDDVIDLPIQINGKLRANIVILADLEENKVKDLVHDNFIVKSNLDGKTIIKEIYIKNKIYNIVVK
jgi:leucyl-tRNA synthetase